MHRSRQGEVLSWTTVIGCCMYLNMCPWTSLVVQWLRLRLPMQGARVQFLVGELDPICHN